MAKNLMGKSRKPGNAYVTVNANGWQWEILKLYQTVANSKKNKYARAFCLVKSPFVPDGEYGDVYLTDIGSTVGLSQLYGMLEAKEIGLAGKVEKKEPERGAGGRYADELPEADFYGYGE